MPRFLHSLPVLLLLALIQPLGAWATSPQSCPLADSVLGMPLGETADQVGGLYDPVRDSTHLNVSVGRIPPVDLIYPVMVFAGRGPHHPVGLPLSLLFMGGEARRVARDRTPHRVKLSLLPDSIDLDLPPPVIAPFGTEGSLAYITVSPVLTKASALALLRSSSARLTWGRIDIVLENSHIGALRALYRAALCAPAGVRVGRWKR